jgi:DNA-binding MarR family transcriptional regulator
MATSASDPSDALTLAEQLRPALHRIIRLLRRTSEDAPISPLQNLLLVAIYDHPGIGVGELANLERVRSPTISGHLKSMAAAGLVKRSTPASGDKRRVGLVVTESGQAMIQAMRKRRTDSLAHALSQLSPESRESIRQAIAALNEIGA